MKKIMLLVALLYCLNSFTQHDVDCDQVMFQYQELAKLHKESFVKFCEQVEQKTIKNNTTIEQITRNKQQFLGSYINFFMNNPKTKITLRLLATSELAARECLKDEIFRYDIKNNFLDYKDEIKQKVNQKYSSTIDFIFKIIIKKLKLGSAI